MHNALKKGGEKRWALVKKRVARAGPRPIPPGQRGKKAWNTTNQKGGEEEASVSINGRGNGIVEFDSRSVLWTMHWRKKEVLPTASLPMYGTLARGKGWEGGDLAAPERDCVRWFDTCLVQLFRAMLYVCTVI